MQKSYQLVYLLLGAAFTFASCVDDGKDLYKPSVKTSELIIPEGFNWETSRTVGLKIQSPEATTASFFLDKECKSENQLANLPVSKGENKFQFDVPYTNNAIYVQYTQVNGTVKTLTGKIEPRTRAGGFDDIDVMNFEQPKVGSSLGEGEFEQWIKIPGTGSKLTGSQQNVRDIEYGTIMFEDTWPEIGDYDFNDFVVNYKVKVSYTLPTGISDDVDMNSPGPDIKIGVDLIFCALGGSYPYDFAIQIGQSATGQSPLKGKSITVENITDNGSIKAEVLQGTDYPAVIITGLESLRESGFYNTVTKIDNGIPVSFTINLSGTYAEQQQRMRSSGSIFSDPRAFDYFLIRKGGQKEIHMMGYAPTSLYKSYKNDNNSSASHYYQSSKGLVWALRIPGKVAWATEKTDITGVYPSFVTWVTSGGYALGSNGADSLPWYEELTEEAGKYIKP